MTSWVNEHVKQQDPVSETNDFQSKGSIKFMKNSF